LENKLVTPDHTEINIFPIASENILIVLFIPFQVLLKILLTSAHKSIKKAFIGSQ
jgi:hypothetical protein